MLFVLVLGLLVSVFLECTESAVNPYHVAPELELPTDTLRGYVGTEIDSLVVNVRNNVEVNEFGITSALPRGLLFNAAHGILYGIPEETANLTCSIYANNEWGRSKKDVTFALQIAPARPGRPVPTSTQTSVTLAWPPVESASGYIVYRKEESEDFFSLLRETDAITVTDDGLTPGTRILYYVVAQTEDSLVSRASDTVQVDVGAEAVQHSPTVQITGPADASSFGLNSQIAITVDVDDEDNNLRAVYFFIDGNVHATVTSAPYSAIWPASSGGEHTIKVVAEDAGGLTAEDSITITVNSDKGIVFVSPANDTVIGISEALSLAAQTLSGGEEPVRILLSLGDSVLAECEASECEFEWTAREGGRREFTATAHYADGDSVSHKITVRVNRAPHLSGVVDTVIAENESLVMQIIGSDPDDDLLTLKALDLPSNAAFQPTGDSGTFTWKPGNGQAGEYSVTFTASDGVESADKTMKIVVTEADRPPNFVELSSKQVDEGEQLSFTVEANDPDGDDVSYSAGGLPNGASFDNETGVFSWKPGYDDANTYTVTFTAESGGLKDEETIEILVRNVDRPPYFEQVPDITVKETDEIGFTLQAHDPDVSMPLSNISHGPLPSGAEFVAPTSEAAGHRFAWTPNYSQAGDYTVSFTVTSEGDTATMDVSITVENLNRPPTLSGDPAVSVGKGNTYTFTIDADDPDGDTVTIGFVQKPDGMEIDGHTITWPVEWVSPYQIGDKDYAVEIEADDSHGGTDTKRWAIDIEGHSSRSKSNDLPADFELLAVLNEDTMYARGSNLWEVHAKFGSSSWRRICEFGNAADVPFIGRIVVANRELFVGGKIDGLYAGIVKYSLTGSLEETLLDSARLGSVDEFTISASPSGDFAAARYRHSGGGIYNSLYGISGDTTIEWGIYANDANSPQDVDASGSHIIAVGTELSFCSTDRGASWFTIDQTMSQVALDCNDGDTAYMINDNSSINLYRSVFTGNSLSTVTLFSQLEKVEQIKMVSGSAGWVVVSDELYFTENGFSTKHKENLGIIGLNVEKLFINKNTRKPFVYAGGDLFY